MKNVAHTHIHATQAQYAKLTLKKLHLASLAPWAVAALSLVGTVAHANTANGSVKVQLQANVATCSVLVPPASNIINLHGVANLPSVAFIFNDWVTRDNLVSSFGTNNFGTWKTLLQWEQITTVECTSPSQKINAFDIVNDGNGSAVPGSAREQYLKDGISGGTTAFGDGKVSAFLTSAGSATGLNHGFNDASSGGKASPYAPAGGFVTGTVANGNGKYTIDMVWYPIVTATGTNPLANPTTYTGSGLFFGDFLINVNF